MSSRYADLLDAIAFSGEKHRNQRRKDAEASPYINHPLQVAHVLASEGCVSDLKTLIAAVLHDTVEDTETTFEELVERFGKRVAGVVKELTDEKMVPKVQRKRVQVERAPQLSKRAAIVRLADNTCNLRDIATHPPKDWPLKRKQAYFDWAKDVVDGLPLVNKKLRQSFDAALTLRP